MLLTSLQLDRAVVTSLHFDAREDVHQSDGAREGRKHDHRIAFTWSFLQRVEDNSLEFKVPVEISVKCKRPRTCSIPMRNLSIGLVGYFSLKEELPPERRGRHIVLNCLTILYGVARGMVLSATASVDGGPLMLPAVDLAREVDVWAEGQIVASKAPEAAPTP